jgi:hypothetical protein
MTPSNAYKTFSYPSAFSSNIPIATPPKDNLHSLIFKRNGSEKPKQISNFTTLPFTSTYDKTRR